MSHQEFYETVQREEEYMNEIEAKERINLLEVIISKDQKILDLQFELAKKDNKIEILEKMLLEKKCNLQHH